MTPVVGIDVMLACARGGVARRRLSPRGAQPIVSAQETPGLCLLQFRQPSRQLPVLLATFRASFTVGHLGSVLYRGGQVANTTVNATVRGNTSFHFLYLLRAAHGALPPAMALVRLDAAIAMPGVDPVEQSAQHAPPAASGALGLGRAAAECLVLVAVRRGVEQLVVRNRQPPGPARAGDHRPQHAQGGEGRCQQAQPPDQHEDEALCHGVATTGWVTGLLEPVMAWLSVVVLVVLVVVVV